MVKVRVFSNCEFDFFFSTFGFEVGFDANASLSALKRGVRPQIDKRLWSNRKL
jgi:hypothetical protein